MQGRKESSEDEPSKEDGNLGDESRSNGSEVDFKDDLAHFKFESNEDEEELIANIGTMNINKKPRQVSQKMPATKMEEQPITKHEQDKGLK